MQTRLVLMTMILSLWATSCERATSVAAAGKQPPAVHEPIGEFERYIQDLSAGKPPAASHAAWEALSAAGAEAFPALIAHFGDRAVAADNVQQATAEPIRVGDACFAILQVQIEGAWPVSIRDFQVLTPHNAASWLAAHRGLTLADLRIAATQESLAQAEAALAKDPPSRVNRGAVKFLTERERALREER
jgi:hypothetical protein